MQTKELPTLQPALICALCGKNPWQSTEAGSVRALPYAGPAFKTATAYCCL